jgi:hypothetical protein
MDKERYDRQLLLFGEEGQARIEATPVAIVGLGGLGSHVAQQLALLGVRSYGLIDGDITTRSSGNRLVGIAPDDAPARRLKVDVAERTIRTLQPEAAIVKVPTSFISYDGYAALAAADLVIGCVDRDSARLVLNEFCQAYEKPYLDIATDVGQEGGLWFGGRILYSIGGELCLLCKDLLDQEALRADFATEAQRQEDDRIYGVPRAVLGQGGPAVVSLNGILASVAVTELMVEVTGIRPAHRSLEYKGMMGRLVVDQDPPAPDCYYCKGVRGQGDRADLQRYIREGWGG